MKHFAKKVTAAILTAIGGFSLFACGTGTGTSDGNPPEQIDSERTQLYVFNFDGGFGSEWLSAAKEKYEELHKDDVYEEGKKGVQIYVTVKKSFPNDIISQIPDNREEIYFTESAHYYTLKNAGVLGDITEAVTERGTYDDPLSIEDRLTAEQKAYLGVEETDGTHYYGIPHYAAYWGIIYNIELFDDGGYYFADEPDPEDDSLAGLFINKRTNPKKSAGPDGEYGTSDDGLPATYDEFYKLCDYIARDGCIPLIWSGKNYTDYLNSIIQSLAADYDGKDQTMLNYTSYGSAETLGKIENGSFVKDVQSTQIDEENGWELSRQAGKYYALQFMEKVIKTTDWHNDIAENLAFSPAYTHMNAQEDFLYANEDGVTPGVAMLLDGCWWQSEAQGTFNDMVDSMGDEYAKENRRFGFMPLPKATEEKAEENRANGADAKKFTLIDAQYSMCFMKSNIEEWKKPLALDFIRFVNTQAQLVEYTQITNTTKALTYSLTDEEKEVLTPFGLSLLEYQGKSDIVYPYSNRAIYVNNQSQMRSAVLFSSRVNGKDYTYATRAFHEDGVTAAEYFSGMEIVSKERWELFG